LYMTTLLVQPASAGAGGSQISAAATKAIEDEIFIMLSPVSTVVSASHMLHIVTGPTVLIA
jgi:hypothetical protein